MTFRNQPHHSYSIELAMALKSVSQASFVNHIGYWVFFNKINKRNFREGRYWTYQTLEDLQGHFPYWSIDQIRTIIKNLVQKGILLKGNFNNLKNDRTVWYSLCEEKIPGCDWGNFQNHVENSKNSCSDDYDMHTENSQSHLVESPSYLVDSPTLSFGGITTPLPNNKQDNRTTNINTPSLSPSSVDIEIDRSKEIHSQEKAEVKPKPKKKKQEPEPGKELIPHGKFVELTSEDYDSLCRMHGKSVTDELLQEINDHCANNRQKGYADYMAAFRTFMRNRIKDAANSNRNWGTRPRNGVSNTKVPDCIKTPPESEWIETNPDGTPFTAKPMSFWNS